MTNATHTVIKVMAKPVFMLQRLPICGQRVGSFTRWFLIAAFIAYFGYNFYCSYYRNQPSSVFQWDYLLLTGIATLWFGLTVVASVDQDFEGMIARLIERGILPEATDHLSLMQLLRDNASRTARIFSLLCALAMLIAFAVATFFDPNYGKLLLAVPASIASYIAGSYLGRMVSYGGLAKQLLHEGLQIEIFPEHVDGVGGLKPVGDFYFRQAMIAAIPAVFLGVWSVIFPYWTGRNYDSWIEAYLMLFIIGLVIVMLAFVAPMVKFHNLMCESKQAALLKADKLSRKIREERESVGTNIDITDIANRIETLRDRYWQIENMPVWPLHLTTLKRFRRNYILLTTPLITRLVDDNTEIGKQIAQILSFFSSGGTE